MLEVIKYAFEGDDDIFKYCDPECADYTLDELALSIEVKIIEYEVFGKVFGSVTFDRVVVDNRTVGYIFSCQDLLISFGINKQYRTKENLQKVFEQIKSNFDGEFATYMWDRNTRAINWLKKCGMVQVDSKLIGVTKLKYSICQ